MDIGGLCLFYNNCVPNVQLWLILRFMYIYKPVLRGFLLYDVWYLTNKDMNFYLCKVIVAIFLDAT